MTRALRASLLTFVLAAAGCTSYTPNRLNVPSEGAPTQELLNEDLAEEVDIVSGGALYEGDIMVNVVTIRNLEDDDRHLDYRWRWFKKGLEVSTGEEHYTSVFLNAKQEKQLTGKAGHPGCDKGVFELRWHRTSSDSTAE